MKLFRVLPAVVVAAALSMSLPSFADNTYRPKSAHVYITGKRGGCYYINKNGNKTYVDRSLCRQR